jgi:soluble lytic murein transglycosylase
MTRLGRRALISLCVIALCGGLAAAASASKTWLLPHPAPKTEMPLKESKAPGMSQPEMEAILARIAPGLPADVRANLGNALLLEAARAGYDPLFLLALMSVESGFRLTVSSERGARGLLQLKPSTFEWISAREPDVSHDDPEQGDDPILDVRLSVRYLRWLEQRFHSRDAALMAYNAGPRRYRQYVRRGKIPESLKDYPRRVMREYARLLRLVAGKGDRSVLIARAP